MRILRKRKIREILNRVAANYIIAADALIKTNMPISEITDALNHITENVIRTADLIGGSNGVNYVDGIITAYKESEE